MSFGASKEQAKATMVAAPLRLRRTRRMSSFEMSLVLMAIPLFAFIILFNYVALLSWWMAVFRYSPGVDLAHSRFIGLKYFSALFTYTSEFKQVMINTFAISLIGIAMSPFPALIAIAISEIRFTAYKKFVQVAISLPNFMSWVIVYSVTFSLFAIDDGLVNNLLKSLGLISTGTNVLGNRNFTWVFQNLMLLWKTAGWTAIIYIASIAGIDPELFEAAAVDGANRLQRILHITIPGIIPTFTVLLLLNIGWMLSGTSFDQIFVFHNSLVHERIQTIDYYVYTTGLKQLNFSLATAMGIFKTVISVALLTLAGLVSKRLVGRSII
jgi:putative aldouronate transport system permease protein